MSSGRWGDGPDLKLSPFANSCLSEDEPSPCTPFDLADVALLICDPRVKHGSIYLSPCYSIPRISLCHSDVTQDSNAPTTIMNASDLAEQQQYVEIGLGWGGPYTFF